MDNKQSSRNWKALGIGGIVLLIIVILFEVIISKNSLTKTAPDTNSNTNETSLGISDWQKYTSSQYGQTIAFQYPPNYAVLKGGRPFNFNNEGTSTAFEIRCSSKDNCQGVDKDSLVIVVYENRKQITMDEWAQKSANRPLAECTKKDPKATFTKSKNAQVATYEFKYVSDKNAARGCQEASEPVAVHGNEVFYENNQSIFNIRKLEVSEKGNNIFDKIIETLKVL